jgi:dTDP-4-dehydrorhamnose reductase
VDFLAKNKFDLVINCAAYTQVDQAEKEVELAGQINSQSVGILAQEVAKQGALLIHISTDYVFNGQSFEPIKETQAPKPINVYGQTKLEGETLALQNNPKTLIIRTCWVYSQFGKNFVKTMRRLIAEKSELSVIWDQIGTPTSSLVLAQALLQIVEKIQATDFNNFGIYHFSGEGVTSWYDFAKTIQRLSGVNTCQIQPIFSSQYPTLAQRPLYSVLDKTKIKQVFELQIPYWQDSLQEVWGYLE